MIDAVASKYGLHELITGSDALARLVIFLALNQI